MYDLAIIIGAMKCGTTSLLQNLSEYPQVCASRIKEPVFFVEERNWDRGLSWYRDLFDWDADHHRWALEASSSYTKRPAVSGVAERIASVPGRKRFIYLMRDPIERIRSHMEFGRAKGWDTFVEAEGIPRKAINISRYWYQIRPFVRRFGRDRILLLSLEELAKAPQEVLDRTCEFLEIESYEFENPERIHNRSSRLLVRPSWYRQLRHHPVVTGARKLIPFKRWVARTLPGFEPAASPTISELDEVRIVEKLRDDLEVLRDEFCVDLDRWDVEI